MKNLYKRKWLNIVLLIILAFCMLSISGFSQENKIIIKLGHHHTIDSFPDLVAHRISEIFPISWIREAILIPSILS